MAIRGTVYTAGCSFFFLRGNKREKMKLFHGKLWSKQDKDIEEQKQEQGTVSLGTFEKLISYLSNNLFIS